MDDEPHRTLGGDPFDQLDEILDPVSPVQVLHPMGGDDGRTACRLGWLTEGVMQRLKRSVGGELHQTPPKTHRFEVGDGGIVGCEEDVAPTHHRDADHLLGEWVEKVTGAKPGLEVGYRKPGPSCQQGGEQG